MHNTQSRKVDYFLGTGLLAASFALLFSTGLIVGSPSSARADLRVVAKPAVLSQCSRTLTSLGVLHSKKDEQVVIAEQSTGRDLPSLVERSSLVLQSCPGYDLAEFCAGEACLPERGLKMVLRVQGS